MEGSPSRFRLLLRWVLAGALLLGVGAHIAQPWLADRYGEWAVVSTDVAKAISEALIVAYVIARMVDPYIKAHFAREIGGDIFWALSNVDAPEKFRLAVRRLANAERYIRVCTWTLSFEWMDAKSNILAVEISNKITGVNLDRSPYRPRLRFWLVPSLDPYRSRNRHWTFDIPDCDVEFELDEQQIDELIEGRTSWDDTLPDEIVVPPGKVYRQTKAATIYTAGPCIPLLNTLPVLKQEYRLTGDALKALDVRITHSGGLQAEEIAGPRRRWDGQVLVIDQASLSGQVSLVTWTSRRVTELELELDEVHKIDGVGG